MGKFLGLPQIEKSLVGLYKCEIRARNDFDPSHSTATGWPEPKDQQNKTDKFLSVFGVLYVIVNSWKDKGKVLKEHILKDIIPRGFDAKIEETQKKYRQAIEEKDAAIALLSDGLQNCDNQIHTIQYENVSLQAQRDVYKDQLQKCQDIITHLRTRYVDHAKDPGKGNIVMIIEKNLAPEEDEFYEYPYYIASIQRWFITTKRRHNIHIIDS